MRHSQEHFQRPQMILDGLKTALSLMSHHLARCKYFANEWHDDIGSEPKVERISICFTR